MTTEARAVAKSLEKKLASLGTKERAEGSQRYLKSDLRFHGTTLPDIRQAAKAFLRARPQLGRDELISVARALWDEPVFERRLIAAILLEERTELLQARDVRFLEHLLRDSHTWALVDELATKVVGPLVERYGSVGRTLDRWAQDEDFWIRRSALLALLGPLRRGGGDFERFGRYADAMLEEKEFFIRKAIGWVLRETSKKRPDIVFEWLQPRVHRASGVTMREAVKYLGDEQASELSIARKRTF